MPVQLRGIIEQAHGSTHQRTDRITHSRPTWVRAGVTNRQHQMEIPVCRGTQQSLRVMAAIHTTALRGPPGHLVPPADHSCLVAPGLFHKVFAGPGIPVREAERLRHFSSLRKAAPWPTTRTLVRNPNRSESGPTGPAKSTTSLSAFLADRCARYASRRSGNASGVCSTHWRRWPQAHRSTSAWRRLASASSMVSSSLTTSHSTWPMPSSSHVIARASAAQGPSTTAPTPPLLQAFCELAYLAGCRWPRDPVYHKLQRADGQNHCAELRKLAHRPCRFLYRLWRTKTRYGEERYQQVLGQKNHRALGHMNA